MPNELFLFQLLLSFILGGMMVALSITLAERFGIKIGTAILSTPSTSLVSFFFMALTNSVDFVVQAIPPGLLSLTATLIFVAVFVRFSEKLKGDALPFSLAAWAVMAFFILQNKNSDLFFGLVVFFIVYIPVNIIFRNRNPDIELDRAKTSKGLFLFRILIAGAVISTAVLLGKTFGPVWGGVFTMFPAAFSSSLFIIQRDHGIKQAASVARNMLPSFIVFVFYSLAVYFVYPKFGIYVGTVVALLPTWLFAYIVYSINQRL